MAHFLDNHPFKWTEPSAVDLKDFLASVYYREKEVLQLVVPVGISPAELALGQPARLLWFDIIEKASNRGVLRGLLAHIVASGDSATGARLTEFLGADPGVTSGHLAGGDQDWKGFDDEEELERLIVEERNTLLDVAFLARGLEIAPSIARLRVAFGTSWFVGTGLRIGEELILTNHHVMFNWDAGDTKADSVEAWFGYERDFGGRNLEHLVVPGDVGTIAGDKTHDWAIFKASEPIPVEYPVLPLVAGKPVSTDDRVYIIQHPEGGPKQIGMHHNLVRHVDDNVIQYWTDTMGGSSGSPVFNRDWGIVGLHHSSLKAGNGKQEVRNQGRRIERVIEGLAAVGLI